MASSTFESLFQVKTSKHHVMYADSAPATHTFFLYLACHRHATVPCPKGLNSFEYFHQALKTSPILRFYVVEASVPAVKVGLFLAFSINTQAVDWCVLSTLFLG